MTNDTLEEYMQTTMRQLRVRYIQRLQEQIEDLEHLQNQLDERLALKDEEYTQLQFLAHKLSGTGTTYGFPMITEKGKVLEQLLLERAAIDKATLKPLVNTLMAACKKAIDSDFDLPVASRSTVKRWNEEVCVIIVDDDENVRSVLVNKFQEAGCKVVAAENGYQGIEAVKLHKPCLVVLDRLMPDIDGMGVLQEIKKIPHARKTPVVFLTSKHTSSDILEGFQHGAVDYIIKPFNSNDVIERCARFLNQA